MNEDNFIQLNHQLEVFKAQALNQLLSILNINEGPYGPYL